MIATQHQHLLASGDVISNKFEIIRLVGTGGMGAVFEAKHLVTGRPLAIKWMKSGSGREQADVARFLREARAAGRIRHPHVVDIYDVGEHAGGHFLVMELLTGEPLSARIRRKPLELHEIPALLTPAIFAIGAAHAEGVIHRDLKPDNIFICMNQDGSIWGPKVLDFGISKVAELAAPSITQSGMALGTPQYMAPEQVRGESGVGPSADIYALGVILYEALSGVAPFRGQTYGAIAIAIATSEVTPLGELRPDLPSAICDVVHKAMSRQSGDRFASAEGLGRALLDLVGLPHKQDAGSASGRFAPLTQAAADNVPAPAGKVGQALSKRPSPRARRAPSPPPLALEDRPSDWPTHASRSDPKAPQATAGRAKSISTIRPLERKHSESGPTGTGSSSAAKAGETLSAKDDPSAAGTERSVSDPVTEVLEAIEIEVVEATDAIAADEVRPNILGKRLGRYELLTELASGGMASVFIARAVGVAGFERLVAVKLLHPHLAHQRDFISMFLDEARLAARIHHPNVVPTLDISDTEADGYYLVMEYIEGLHLGGLLRSAAKRGNRLPTRIVCKLLIDALDGLAAAHSLTDDRGEPLNLVHRDVSPANVLVGTDGVARLTDFGVAKAEVRLTRTRTGQIKGKLTYMSPEHVSSGDADQRSDLFSMAIVLWESLTGGRLFRGANNGATLHKILTAPIPAPSEVADELAPFDALLRKALDRDPDGRFQTAEEFITALEQVARDHGGVATTREVGKFTRPMLQARVSEQKDRIDRAVADLGHRDIRDDRKRQSGASEFPPTRVHASPPATPASGDVATTRSSRAKKAGAAAVVLLAVAVATWFALPVAESAEEVTASAPPIRATSPALPSGTAPSAAPRAPDVEVPSAATPPPTIGGERSPSLPPPTPPSPETTGTSRSGMERANRRSTPRHSRPFNWRDF